MLEGSFRLSVNLSTLEGGASLYTVFAVLAPLGSGDCPSTARPHLSLGRSHHRNETDIGGQGACGPCGKPGDFCPGLRRLRLRTRFQELPYQVSPAYVV